MPYPGNNLALVTTNTHSATASRTASFNTTGLDLTGYEGDVVLVVTVGAVGGTSPTLDGVLKDSADNSTFAAVSPAQAMTQVTASTSHQTFTFDVRNVRRYVRIEFTIGGTSPTFLMAVVAVLQKKVTG